MLFVVVGGGVVAADVVVVGVVAVAVAVVVAVVVLQTFCIRRFRECSSGFAVCCPNALKLLSFPSVMLSFIVGLSGVSASESIKATD